MAARSGFDCESAETIVKNLESQVGAAAGDGTHRPLRIAHLADTHLGYSAYGKADPISGRNQRAVDFERSFEAAITDILTRDVDLVLHAGDVFHHTRPSWSTLAHFVRQMRRIEARGIPTVVIAGNHDTPRMRTTGSVYGLLALALPGIRFITGYETDEASLPNLNLTVHCVPHGALIDPDPPTVLPAPSQRNIIVAHGNAPGYEHRGSHEAGEVELRGNILDSDFDYIALGHIHIRGEVGINIHYSGSTERTSWGDEKAEPGYLLVNLGDPGSKVQVEEITIPARPMVTLTPIDGSDRSARDLADTILARTGALDISEAMVRVELRGTPRPVFRETEAIVRREIGDSAWYVRLTIPGDRDDVPPRPPAELEDLHPLALFNLFVDRQEAAGRYDPPFARSFRERGRTALERSLLKLQEATTDESVH
jgi:DNA repair exonuclease SbcCD nuclease subunit